MTEAIAKRLDRALVDLGLTRSRAQAQAAIASGQVTVNGKVRRKPSEAVSPMDEVSLSEPVAYVGRGGIKLAAALDSFGIDPAGLCCLDLGASTGGFTDCLLQRGAAHVAAVDVGAGQMAESIARDPRVCLHERVNARALTESGIPGPFDLVVADLSFISLTLVMGSISQVLRRPSGRAIVLIKPQFEVGRARLGRGGIVRNALHREEAVAAVTMAAEPAGLIRRGLIESPIQGGDGNIEFLALFSHATDCEPTQ